MEGALQKSPLPFSLPPQEGVSRKQVEVPKFVCAVMTEKVCYFNYFRKKGNQMASFVIKQSKGKIVRMLSPVFHSLSGLYTSFLKGQGHKKLERNVYCLAQTSNLAQTSASPERANLIARFKF